MMYTRIDFLAALALLLASCQLTPEPKPDPKEEPDPADTTAFIRGADLSYVNEMLACGAVYFNEAGQQRNPYDIFEEAGANLVRVRLWHNPDWTAFSDEADVMETIRQAKVRGMKVLLDFHYSDDWADPGNQEIPAAWLGVADNVQALGDSVYNYTSRVLRLLDSEGLLPEYVQVGNEINREILHKPGQGGGSINWSRNVALLNRGLSAVRDVGKDTGAEIGLMLHIAQPENAIWWFREATQNGLTNYDWIGLSYYSVWSGYSLDALSGAIQTLRTTYNKRVMVVETAYPFTLTNADQANNILGSDALVQGYEASESGQLAYLKALEKSIEEGGGEGLIYWEPAWISTTCGTRWGQGSHWDNATLFNHSRQATQGMKYYSGE